MVQDLQQAISKLEARLSALEKSSPAHRATAPQTQVSILPRHRDPTPGTAEEQEAKEGLHPIYRLAQAAVRG